MTDLPDISDIRPAGEILRSIFNKLFHSFGPQHWWPGETPFEVIIGAILTQNTAWSNVEKAVCALKQNSLLSPSKLKNLTQDEIASYIKPSGYFNQKSKKIKIFLDFFELNFSSDIEKMKLCDSEELRTRLLGLFGIGPETADSILLYALDKPYFVIDSYTRRIFCRHKLISETQNYESIRAFFESNLDRDTGLYNEFHALIVRTGKYFCRKIPLCDICPLNEYL